MALNIKNFIFLPTDYSLIYEKGSSADDRQKNDPKFVKIFGFALDYNMNPTSCYLLESFDIFGISKSNLIENLTNHCIIRSSGMISNDQNYFHKLNLQDYIFSDSFDFTDLVDFN